MFRVTSRLSVLIAALFCLSVLPAWAGSSLTTTWTGNGVITDGGNKTLKQSVCNAESDPYLVFLLSGTSASTATITMDGSSRAMTKVITGKNQSTWKYVYPSGSPIDLDSLLSSPVTANYNGKDRGILTIGSGCLGATAPSYTWKMVSGGRFHTCAVTMGGDVRCWGANFWGALGTGDNTSRNAPGSAVNLGAGRTALLVGAGNGHSCALLDDYSVKCWGLNEAGALGIGNTTNLNTPGLAVNLGIGRTATDIAVGHYHSCAVLDDGSLKCWGSNLGGQLGTGDQTNRTSPAAVNLGAGRTAVAIAAGENFTCAILDDESVKCWGSNFSGQLGIGSYSDQSQPTTTVALGGGARAIQAGERFACALLTNNTVKCWGENSEGELGIGTTTGLTSPGSAIDFGLSRTVKKFGVGDYHGCAVLSDDSLSCWGLNFYGALGMGDLTMRTAPNGTVNLGTGLYAKTVDGGVGQTCAILNDNTMKCWGSNVHGELGLGSASLYVWAPTVVITW